MISRLVSLWRAFRKQEDGNATIEFVIIFPALLVLMLSGVELAFVSLNHAMLERAVDMTVRDIRLGTGRAHDHDDIKDVICERAGFIEDCASNLKLEMIRLDPYANVSIPVQPDCTDTSDEVKPVRSFVNGQSNELMVLRACAKINPVFPTSG
ncbi:TadE/TadG family type IV pilus assembly protein, partial [Cribrihabitans sp. XS_ASV171]